MTRRFAILALVLLAATVGPLFAQPPAPRTMILSTTTSTQDSGLLDVLVPQFERKTGYAVKTISVGTGQALALAARGEADATLAHAPALEKKYVDEGKMLNRRLVMYNDFVIIGPEADPAKIRGEKSAVAALKRIAEAQARFVSRGDKSARMPELTLWKQAVSRRPRRGTSNRARDGGHLWHRRRRQAYTITDRATLLASPSAWGSDRRGRSAAPEITPS
jgi:tungstate transport system substrate-binding protein